MSSPRKQRKDSGAPSFSIGPAAKRELRRALVRSSDPAATIQEFQQSHSLHSMMAKAFGTTPRYEPSGGDIGRTPEDGAGEEQGNPETLDTDSVMTFLSHLGITQHEVHKRISDTLLKQLDEEIRKTQSEEPLLRLLKNCWPYVVSYPDLRPVLGAVLKQLGERTPLAILKVLSEREKGTGELKHKEIFRSLTPLLKRLCWEADWDTRIPLELETDAYKYLQKVKSTLLFETIEPLVEEYCSNTALVQSANLPFVASKSDRRMLTTQRRALTKSSAASAPASTSGTTTASLLRPARTGTASAPSTSNPFATSGKAVAQLKTLLSDGTVGSASAIYRPKLLYALLSTLISKHGALDDQDVFLGGAEYLHCTLVTDVLLSAGGSLPKAYNDVLELARVLDECVREGSITNEAIKRIQACLGAIFQPDLAETEDETGANSKPEDLAITNAMIRQLNLLIISGLNALKENDPQNLFINPVTDAIAPDYSKIIMHPMCISQMQEKVEKREYTTLTAWEADVKLMFKNCIVYNRGPTGKWFRSEAQRQGKVFQEEIFPRAKEMFQAEIDKRVAAAQQEEESRKRKAQENDAGIKPLSSSTKKRKKEREELPSMPALALMILADPFVVRILLARVLRDLRVEVMGKSSLPMAHGVVPSLLQILHLSRWSTQICAIRGKRFFVPDSGLVLPAETNEDDKTARIPYISLREFLPLLVGLMLQEEIDRRTVSGGDLHEASQESEEAFQAPGLIEWKTKIVVCPFPVVAALLQGILVHICQPGGGNEVSLSITFPKYAEVLKVVTPDLKNNRVFFLSLSRALRGHRSKLLKETRDSVVSCWFKWIEGDGPSKEGAMTSGAHECLIQLLNDWSALGNLLLPRDKLVEFATKLVSIVDATEESSERKFSAVWSSKGEISSRFEPVQTQYLRMLKRLPQAQASEWKQQVGVDNDTVNEESMQDRL